MPDFQSLPREERQALVPPLLKLLEASEDKYLPGAFGRTNERDLIEPLRRHARAKGSEACTPVLYGLVDCSILTDSERLEIAMETGFSYMWNTLQSRIPRARWDELRVLAEKSEPYVRVSIAKALISSGDARPFPSLGKPLREYPWGLAAVRVLTEGEACAKDLMQDCLRRLSMETQAAGEIMMALSAFQTPEIEKFLWERLEEGPILLLLEERRSRLREGFDPDGPPADALRALANLRSPRLRKSALQVARTTQNVRPLYCTWGAALESLGVLEAEGGLEETLSWLEDSLRDAEGGWIRSTALDVLGALGDNRHVGLVRRSLDRPPYRIAAARCLDRIVHRESYRALAEPRVLRHVRSDDIQELARLLSSEWGLPLRLPEHWDQNLDGRSHRFTAVWRVDGFRLLNLISDAIDAAPLFRNGGIEFLRPDAAAAAWAEK